MIPQRCIGRCSYIGSSLQRLQEMPVPTTIRSGIWYTGVPSVPVQFEGSLLLFFCFRVLNTRYTCNENTWIMNPTTLAHEKNVPNRTAKRCSISFSIVLTITPEAKEEGSTYKITMRKYYSILEENSSVLSPSCTRPRQEYW